MIISCPWCGARDSAEFVYRGDAAPTRPAIDGTDSDVSMVEYVYLRDNPAGRMKEHWYHAAGCRRWLVIERDTRSHEIFNVQFASEPGDGDQR